MYRFRFISRITLVSFLLLSKKACSQSKFGILKITTIDTIINNKPIRYKTFYNRLNHTKGLMLRKSPIVCEIVIKNSLFAITPGNIDTKKVFIYTEIKDNDKPFNSKSNGIEDGMWLYYTPSGHVHSIDYYQNSRLHMALYFRKDGSLESIFRFTDGRRNSLGNWFYDKKGRALNLSPDF